MVYVLKLVSRVGRRGAKPRDPSFPLARSPPWASQVFLSPVRSTSARTPGSPRPTLHRRLPHATGQNVSRKACRMGARGAPDAHPPGSHICAPTHGYLGGGEDRCGAPTPQPQTRLTALGSTDALERSASRRAEAASGSSQWASSPCRSQPMGGTKLLTGGRANRQPRPRLDPGAGRASRRSWPEHRVSAGIGWRGSVRSADWPPGNGLIPRVGRKPAGASCGSGVFWGFSSGGRSCGSSLLRGAQTRRGDERCRCAGRRADTILGCGGPGRTVRRHSSSHPPGAVRGRRQSRGGHAFLPPAFPYAALTALHDS